MTPGVTCWSGKQRDLSSGREVAGEGAAEWMEVFSEEMPMRAEIRRIPLSMRHDCTNTHNRNHSHVGVLYVCVCLPLHFFTPLLLNYRLKYTTVFT